MTKHSTV